MVGTLEVWHDQTI